MATDPSNSAASSSDRRSLYLLIGIVIALLGIGVSIYSLVHHLEVHATGHTDAACNINQTFNCDEVALSKYSEVGGVPLGVFGIGYFAAIVLLLGTALIGHKSENEHMQGYTLLVVIGAITSVVLGSISYFGLGHVCLACMGIYILTFLQLILVLVGKKELIPADFGAKSALNGATTAAIVVAVAVAGFNFLKPAHQPQPVSDPAAATRPTAAELGPKAEDIPLAKSAYSGLGEDYRKGGDEARVVIQEFADFQCPACAHMSQTLEQLHAELGDKVLIVFRNYPLDNSCNSAIKNKMHEWACKAAVMARCAGQYGKFWPYFELAYGHQQDINEANLKAWAKQLGITDEQVQACWSSPDLLNKVQDDIALGNRLGIDSTPTVYMNGRKVLGSRSPQDLKALVEEQLAK